MSSMNVTAQICLQSPATLNCSISSLLIEKTGDKGRTLTPSSWNGRLYVGSSDRRGHADNEVTVHAVKSNRGRQVCQENLQRRRYHRQSENDAHSSSSDSAARPDIATTSARISQILWRKHARTTSRRTGIVSQIQHPSQCHSDHLNSDQPTFQLKKRYMYRNSHTASTNKHRNSLGIHV